MRNAGQRASPRFAALAIVILLARGLAFAENINPADDGSKYAWAENLGWINFQPSGPGGPGVQVSDTGLTGWAWAENAGWISLSCQNTSSCGTNAYGVTNNGCGGLSGYAWSEKKGWINFAPTGAGVAINPTTGIFSGRAWSENAGWITFSSASPNPYHVATSWTRSCNDNNSCTDDSCVAGTGCAHANNTATCNDGNACTTADTCGSGACAGGSVINCDDGSICTIDTCNPASGCVHTPIACSDGDGCTFDTCSDPGACQHAVTCEASVSQTLPPGGTATTDPNLNGATPDHQIQTAVTVPSGGDVTIHEGPATRPLPSGYDIVNLQVEITAPAATVESPLVLVFRIDATALPQGYVLDFLTIFRNGVAIANCTDSSGHAAPNPCLSSRLVLGDGDVQITVLTSEASVWNAAFPNCDDGNPCTNDSGAYPSCVHVNNTATCNDGNACTQPDTCQSGACTGQNPVVCTASDQCHPAGTCDLATGVCSNPNAADGTVCGDGNPCTVGETCRAGNCLAPVSLTPPAGSPVVVGSNSISVAAGDVNGDGKLDLVVANQSSHDVTILLGNGLGGFSPAAGSPVPVGTNPDSVAVGDVNGDGKLDLAAANASSNNVTILLGNGSGGFAEAAGSPVAVGTNPRSVRVGDWNGDGKLDLVVANRFSDNLTILLGNGLGGFSQAAGSPVPVGEGPYSVAAGDVNGDGKLDLVAANRSSHNVTILLGNGSGGFSQAAGSPTAVGANPEAVAVADMNGDGKRDLAVANASSNNVTILLGDGSGGFSQATGSPLAVGANPDSVAVADMNRDGKLDLVVANYSSNNVTILLGNGAGGFSQAAGSPVAVGSNPVPVAVGDWNGDGRLDLAVANFSSGNLTILLNSTTSAEDGTACTDGNACTVGDVCTAGSCGGTPVPPPSAINNSVRLDKTPTNATISWNDPPSLYNVYRGSRATGAAWSYNQTCLSPGVAGSSAQDTDAPLTGLLFYYLVSRQNSCNESSLGQNSAGADRPNGAACGGGP